MVNSSFPDFSPWPSRNKITYDVFAKLDERPTGHIAGFAEYVKQFVEGNASPSERPAVQSLLKSHAKALSIFFQDEDLRHYTLRYSKDLVHPEYAKFEVSHCRIK